MISIAIKPTKFTLRRRLAGLIVLYLTIFVSSVSAQSTLQEFPTPVTSSQINGTINARQIGDSRLTSHFYVFDGVQGDIFVNFLTKNFNGDFDIFVIDGLRPLSKIVSLSGFGEYETGRVLYLRKPERLLLRVQGRTPDDLQATYQIKFAGSFVALNENDVPKTPDLPTVTRAQQPEAVAKQEALPAAPVTEEFIAAAPPKVVPDEPKTPPVPAEDTTPESPATPRVLVDDRTAETQSEKEETNRQPKRILNLVVEFMDGSRIERPMSEVNRFSVDGGRLVIIEKQGRPRRYSMNDVVRVSIE